MRVRSPFILALFIMTASTFAQTQDPKWSSLLSRLGDDDFKVRQAAQKELSDVPVSERPLLEELADKATDLEVKSRLQTRLAELNEEFPKPVSLDLDIDPPPVSLDLNDVTLRDAFKELSKQTGLNIKGSGDDDRRPNDKMDKRITVRIDQQPFWAAWHEISKREPLYPSFDLGSWKRNLQVDVGNHWAYRGMSAKSGPVLLILSRVERRSSVSLGETVADAKTEIRGSASFTLLIDPRIRMASSFRASSSNENSGQLRFTEVTDDKGNSLLPAKEEARTNVGWNLLGQANAGLPLHYPENHGTRIATMKGTLTYTAETQSRHVDLKIPEEGAPPAVSHFDGMIVTLKKFDFNNGHNTKIGVKLERGEMDKTQWENRDQSGFLPRLQLLDAAGETLNDQFTLHKAADANMYEYDFMFAKNFDPRFMSGKLRIAITTKTREITVPFEFRDILLP
ncbi:MAG: hypothetical protein FWD53_05180 [Phycisphaerales bacterium]|nr:hypothetical protein [Phycisphaerales bacterium]